MQYIATHPRRIRGEAVHMTASEKRASEMAHNSETRLKEPSIQVRIKCPANLDCSYDLISADDRRKPIEEAFLIPEADHFISTSEVTEMEDRMTLWLKAGYPIHLIGPTGCGKTSLAVHVAKVLGRPVVWINGDESITTADLIGGYSQIQNESVRDNYIHNVFKSKDTLKIEWVDNPLSLACKYGYTLIYNEFSRTKPASNQTARGHPTLKDGVCFGPRARPVSRSPEIYGVLVA